MVARSLGEERGACWKANFVHLGGEEFQVDTGEAREERTLSEVVDSGRHRSFLCIECIVLYVASVARGWCCGGRLTCVYEPGLEGVLSFSFKL